MLYEHTCSRVYNRPLLLHPEKLEEICQVIDRRRAGLKLDAASLAELRAANESRRKVQVQRSVAVLPILGTLAMRAGPLEESSGMMSTQQIGRELERLAADESVGAILLDIDSPGGEVFGVEELAAKIRAVGQQKPVVAIANPWAASAAYWLASAAGELVATPSGMVGSVGVYMAHVDQSAWNEQIGMKVTYIHAGEHKVETNPDQPLAPETLAHLQSEVDKWYGKFVAAVAQGRNTTAADVKTNYGQGRMLQAKDAKTAGMIDRIETIEETVARLAGGAKPKRSSSKTCRERLKIDALR